MINSFAEMPAAAPAAAAVKALVWLIVTLSVRPLSEAFTRIS
jgi:hypothetical protein